jgi:hypothetical protein
VFLRNASIYQQVHVLFSKLSIKHAEIKKSKFRCLSEVTPYHHNVFTFTLLIPEGRASVAWEPSNKMKLSPPSENKVSLTSPLNFLCESTLHLSFPSLFRHAVTTHKTNIEGSNAVQQLYRRFGPYQGYKS